MADGLLSVHVEADRSLCEVSIATEIGDALRQLRAVSDTWQAHANGPAELATALELLEAAVAFAEAGGGVVTVDDRLAARKLQLSGDLRDVERAQAVLERLLNLFSGSQAFTSPDARRDYDH